MNPIKTTGDGKIPFVVSVTTFKALERDFVVVTDLEDFGFDDAVVVHWEADAGFLAVDRVLLGLRSPSSLSAGLELRFVRPPEVISLRGR